MILASKSTTFDCAHRLGFHKGKCFNLHGHTYKLEATFMRGDGNTYSEDDMVVDFADAGKMLKEVAERYDHATILCANDDIDCAIGVVLESNNLKHIWHAEFPTAENMLQIIREELQELCSEYDNLYVVELRLWETPTSYVEVR